MKDRLIFDASDVNTILESDNVGAFVRASDGTLITKHATGKVAASVVYDTVTFTAVTAGSAGNSIALVFNGTDDVATVVGVWNAANPSNTVGYSGLGTYVPAAGTATLVGGTDNQGLDVWMLNPSVVVTATDLDIRSLSAATDSVDSWLSDGAGNAISSTSGALDVNIASSDIVIDVDLDGIYNVTTNPVPDNTGVVFFTRAVTPGLAQQVELVTAAVQGTVAVADVSKVHALDVNAFGYAKDDSSGDLEQLTLSNTNGGLNVNIKNSLTVSDAAIADTSIISKAKVLASAGTAETVVTAPIANRKYLFIYNNFNRVMYIGGSDVTAANGFPISPSSYIELRAGATANPYFDSAVSSHAIRTLQLN